MLFSVDARCLCFLLLFLKKLVGQDVIFLIQLNGLDFQHGKLSVRTVFRGGFYFDFENYLLILGFRK